MTDFCFLFLDFPDAICASQGSLMADGISPAPKFWITDLDAARKSPKSYTIPHLFLKLGAAEETVCASFTRVCSFSPQIPLNLPLTEPQDASGKERDLMKRSAWDVCKQHYRKLICIRTIPEQIINVSLFWPCVFSLTTFDPLLWSFSCALSTKI